MVKIIYATFLDVQAAINELRVWRESQRQKFLEKQLIEHKKSGIWKINKEHLSENNLGTKTRQLLYLNYEKIVILKSS